MQGSEIIIPDWLYFGFTFVLGSCVGSFLNVVIYRIPREKSLVVPGSACPKCGRGIQFYDNIPLFSWVALRGKCRYCKARISPRYFVIELLTGLVFLGTFYLYFNSGLRSGMPSFFAGGGWLIYLVSVIMLAALTASSAIDLEMWIIPLSICWFATAAGIIGSSVAPLLIDSGSIRHFFLMPTTADLIIVNQSKVAALSAGAAVGLGISYLLLWTRVIKRSYDLPSVGEGGEEAVKQDVGEINDRVEVCKEILFLLPIVVCALGANWLVNRFPAVHQWWLEISQIPVIAGLLGSVGGYFAACGIVWATRILGTLAFGREAMGLGDVHLMGAAGVVIGPLFSVIAFFIAPFFGLGWAGIQMLSRKTRQIPYGPFLSMGVVTVMILHDRILSYLSVIFNM